MGGGAFTEKETTCSQMRTFSMYGAGTVPVFNVRKHCSTVRCVHGYRIARKLLAMWSFFFAGENIISGSRGLCIVVDPNPKVIETFVRTEIFECLRSVPGH